jgi:8-oxo-dGTP pyrophosphatase MutT (NUDIX family)
MLELDPSRKGVLPRDAATLVVVRDVAGGGLETFCVERRKAGFLGGAIVFPGGKVDASDYDDRWGGSVTPPRVPRTPIASDASAQRALAIAACREALEEAAILPVAGGALTHAELLGWRAHAARSDDALRSMLAAHSLQLDLASLYPFARWITPQSESRRFDARFFLFVASEASTGAHDGHETTASFWGRPGEILHRFVCGELQLAPPTHRTLEILQTARDCSDAVAIAEQACLEPICPQLIAHRDARGETMAIALPGDPDHLVRVARVAGKSRYVLRGDRFFPEDPPG